MKSFLILLLVIISGNILSQVTKNGKIIISVNNHLSTALENTTVELLRSKDSGLVKTAITDKLGVAVLEKLAPDTYIKASMVNYSPQYSAAITLTKEHNNLIVPSISLQQRSGELKEVAVTTLQPFIQKLR